MQSCFVHFKAIAKVVGRNREIAYTRFVDPNSFGVSLLLAGPSVVFGHGSTKFPLCYLYLCLGVLAAGKVRICSPRSTTGGAGTTS